MGVNKKSLSYSILPPMRGKSLHPSALSPFEYQLFYSALEDLEPKIGDYQDDVVYTKLTVITRDVRAWLRGRYLHIQASSIDLVRT